MVMCTARPAFSAASDAASTAVADPGDAAVAAGEAAGGEAAGEAAAALEPAGAELTGPELPGAVGAGAGAVFVPLQAASSASPARVASVDAGRDRFTFLCYLVINRHIGR
jgi:hypothetical protein